MKFHKNRCVYGAVACKPITNFRFKNSGFRLRRCLCACARPHMRTHSIEAAAHVQKHIYGRGHAPTNRTIQNSLHMKSSCIMHQIFNFPFSIASVDSAKVKKKKIERIHVRNEFMYRFICIQSDQMWGTHTHTLIHRQTHKRKFETNDEKKKTFLERFQFIESIQRFLPECLWVFTSHIIGSMAAIATNDARTSVCVCHNQWQMENNCLIIHCFVFRLDAYVCFDFLFFISKASPFFFSSLCMLLPLCFWMQLIARIYLWYLLACWWRYGFSLLVDLNRNSNKEKKRKRKTQQQQTHFIRFC